MFSYEHVRKDLQVFPQCISQFHFRLCWGYHLVQHESLAKNQKTKQNKTKQMKKGKKKTVTSMDTAQLDLKRCCPMLTNNSCSTSNSLCLSLEQQFPVQRNMNIWSCHIAFWEDINIFFGVNQAISLHMIYMWQKQHFFIPNEGVVMYT